jgi:hypothetical protein
METSERKMTIINPDKINMKEEDIVVEVEGITETSIIMEMDLENINQNINKSRMAKPETILMETISIEITNITNVQTTTIQTIEGIIQIIIPIITTIKIETITTRNIKNSNKTNQRRQPTLQKK